MKRVDELKGVRQQRMFDKRMEAHKALKRRQMEIELCKHSDLIEDPKIKEYIEEKKAIRQHAKEQNAIKNSKKTTLRAKMAVVDKDQMEVEQDEEPKVQQKALAKVRKSSRNITKAK